MEAKAVIDAIIEGGEPLDMPIAYDVEDMATQGQLSKDELTEVIKAFKAVIEIHGAKFMIYANKNWLDNKIDMDYFADEEVWIARYRDYTPDLSHGYMGKGNVTIWQYSDRGTVEGIPGPVDMDICYKSY